MMKNKRIKINASRSLWPSSSTSTANTTKGIVYRGLVSILQNGSLVCSIQNPHIQKKPRVCYLDELPRILSIFAQLHQPVPSFSSKTPEYARPANFLSFQYQDGTQVLTLQHQQLLFTIIHSLSQFEAKLILLHMKSVFLTVQAETDVSRFIEEDFKYQEQQIHNTSGVSVNHDSAIFNQYQESRMHLKSKFDSFAEYILFTNLVRKVSTIYRSVCLQFKKEARCSDLIIQSANQDCLLALSKSAQSRFASQARNLHSVRKAFYLTSRARSDTQQTPISRLGPSVCLKVQNERLMFRFIADKELPFNYILLTRFVQDQQQYMAAVQARITSKRAFLNSKHRSMSTNYFRKHKPRGLVKSQTGRSLLFDLELNVLSRFHDFIKTHSLLDISVSMQKDTLSYLGKPVKLRNSFPSGKKGRTKSGSQSLSLSSKEEIKSKRIALLDSLKYPEKSETMGLDFAQYHPEPEDIIPEHKEEGSLQITIEKALKRQASLIHVTLEEAPSKKFMGLMTPVGSKSSKNVHRFKKTPRLSRSPLQERKELAQSAKIFQLRGISETPTNNGHDRYRVSELINTERELQGKEGSLMVEDVE